MESISLQQKEIAKVLRGGNGDNKTGEDGKQHILTRFDRRKRPNNRKIESELKTIAFLLYIFYV